MDDRRTLMVGDKEKLVDEILDLRQRNKTLQEELDRLRKENESLKKKSPAANKPTFAKAVAKKKSKPPHLWGRKKGHPGAWRPVPDHIDRDVPQTLAACPDCLHALGEPAEVEEHIQEDIVPARVEVTRFLRHRYWCPGCKKMITAPYAPDEVPCGHLGPRTLATICWFKYHLALPGNKIKDIFYDLCGLYVSEGAIAQALQRLGNYLQIETDQILKAVKESAQKHVDETGWKINGALHWLWTFVNGEWAFFHIDKSRGGRVPKAFLGVPHQGTVSSDFHRSYDGLRGDKQKCLVHLRRDIHNARNIFPSGAGPPPDFQRPDKKLRRLLDDAIRLAERRNTFSRKVLARRVRRMKDRLLDFALGTYSHAFWQRISARLLKHHKDLFTFLEKPEVPPDNNTAERAIRPHVIIRNRSFQNRTVKGALAHSRLTSLLHTLRLQKRDVVSALMMAYPKHRRKFGVPILFPPASC
jgi:transposase